MTKCKNIGGLLPEGQPILRRQSLSLFPSTESLCRGTLVVSEKIMRSTQCNSVKKLKKLNTLIYTQIKTYVLIMYIHKECVIMKYLLMNPRKIHWIINNMLICSLLFPNANGLPHYLLILKCLNYVSINRNLCKSCCI